MTDRRTENLEIIEKFYAQHDSPIKPNTEIENFGTSSCDLCCGRDGTTLLRNFTVQEAQDFFGREKFRTVTKCPTCGSYNLIAAAIEKGNDGSVVILPKREG